MNFKFISYMASERSERDTYRGNTIENRGCLLIGERAKRARQYLGWIMQNRVYVICICMWDGTYAL